MGLNTTKVIIGLADQTKTTGALSRGPVITNIPETMEEALAAIAGFKSSGYFTEDGASLTTEISTNDIREWNGAIVRKLLESFDGTVSATLIQADYEGWCELLGEENVTKIDATAEHGEQLHIRIGAHLAKPQAWALRMKDGDYRMLVLVPNGQVTSGLELTFSAGEAVALPLEIAAADDGTGDNIHIYTDDGVKVDVPAADATLAALAVGSLTLDPTFDTETTEYEATTANASDAVTATASAEGASVAIVANGNAIASGDSVSWNTGENTVVVTVTNGTSTKTYTVTVTKGE